ncbi:uncharacterized protein LOC126834688 [Adelges cooleyi]|uniref:uncharacterized protein LOC126834688 n=1 Tax=Adelges cooleyi TaxID=133065 RepID=UPI00217F8E88|nr:uncharacterized protein LOC126834688 [Adelges cooleyi]
MNVNYLILLCVTFYIPAINAIEKPELDFLWNAIKNVQTEKDYIQWSDLMEYYKVNEIQFIGITTRFGVTFKNDKGKSDVKMYYDGFIKAADEGYIPRWDLSVIREKFEEIASKGQFEPNITIADIEKYDVEKKFTPKDIDDIMEKFGLGERLLTFYRFSRAVNTDTFPVLDLNARLYKLQECDRTGGHKKCIRHRLIRFLRAIRHRI